MNTLLESERLILKPLSEEHCTEQYLGWLHDDEVVKYLESNNYPKTIEELKESVRAIDTQNVIFLAIHIKNNGKHIGNIKIHEIQPLLKCAEYGILLGDKSEWGKGFAREASHLVFDYCFNTLGINKITLGVISENIEALALYKKMGFIEESVIKGIPYDVIRMVLFNHA